MVNSEELIGTTGYLMLYTRCRINRCRYNRPGLYTVAVKILGMDMEVQIPRETDNSG